MGSSVHENVIFWALWLATLVICVQQLFQASLKRDTILGFVPPFCMMFGYFYVVQAAIVAVNLADRVSPTYLVLGQLVALTSLVGCLWGWHRGAAGSTRTDPHDNVVQNTQTLWYLSICAILVALVGQYTFFSSTIFRASGYQEASAYWYLLFHVAYPGLAICVSLISRRPEFRGGGPTLLILIFSALLMFPWVVAARRGPLFPFFVVVIYSYYLMRPKLVNRAVVIGGLGAAGVLMLLFFMIRDYSATGVLKYNEDRLQRSTALDIITGKAYEESDNEFLYHCVTVGSVIEMERFQWCTGYLSLAMHWIPRSWWPDKPPLAQGWLDPLSKDDMFNLTGVYMTPGASVGGVAESFIETGWFTPIFWYAIGWVVGRIYLYGRRHPTRVGPIIYVGILAGSHWLISQGFAAAFVPIAIYVTVPIVIFAVATSRRPAPTTQYAIRGRRAPALISR